MECKNKFLVPACFIVCVMNFIISLVLLCDVAFSSRQMDEVMDYFDSFTQQGHKYYDEP